LRYWVIEFVEFIGLIAKEPAAERLTGSLFNGSMAELQRRSTLIKQLNN
jgi:hypothetical protein